MIIWRYHFVDNSENTPPKITQHPEDQNVTLSSQVILSCVAEGRPQPLIQWYKDDKPLSAFEQNYTINSVQPNDRGSYHCRATSVAFKETKVSNSASVLIQGLIQLKVDLRSRGRRRRQQNQSTDFIDQVSTW